MTLKISPPSEKILLSDEKTAKLVLFYNVLIISVIRMCKLIKTNIPMQK